MSMTSFRPLLAFGPRNLVLPFDRTALVTLLALTLGAAMRFRVNADAPLWFDKSITGVFASEDSLAGVLRNSLTEMNAPLYHFVAYFAAWIFGLSDQGLRAPALIFGLIAPLLCLLASRELTRQTRMLWCALTALWFYGVYFSQEARCYSLLQCLSILLTIAFMNLMATRPRSVRFGGRP